MASMLQDQQYKDREHVRAEIRRCARASNLSAFLSFLFVALGVIGDALHTTLVLQPTIWLLLAVVAAAHQVSPTLHLVAAKHFLGVEAENKSS